MYGTQFFFRSENLLTSLSATTFCVMEQGFWIWLPDKKGTVLPAGSVYRTCSLFTEKLQNHTEQLQNHLNVLQMVLHIQNPEFLVRGKKKFGVNFGLYKKRYYPILFLFFSSFLSYNFSQQIVFAKKLNSNT